MKNDFFISYSSEDNEKVQEIVESLEVVDQYVKLLVKYSTLGSTITGYALSLSCSLPVSSLLADLRFSHSSDREKAIRPPHVCPGVCRFLSDRTLFYQDRPSAASCP